MAINQSVVTRSRLGQLIVKRKLITEDQLDEAVQLQQSTGKRLGEILVEQGWVTQRQLDRALRKQTNIRLVAAVVATLMSPFQMVRASDLASSSPDLAQHELVSTFETQSGLLSGITSGQNIGDIANITQAGEDNLAAIAQSGSHDLATIVQSGGTQNTALINQQGNNQVASITQSGNHNAALISQR